MTPVVGPTPLRNPPPRCPAPTISVPPVVSICTTLGATRRAAALSACSVASFTASAIWAGAGRESARHMSELSMDCVIFFGSFLLRRFRQSQFNGHKLVAAADFELEQCPWSRAGDDVLECRNARYRFAVDIDDQIIGS